MLIRELLEVVQDLFLDYGRQALHLLHQDSHVHVKLTSVAGCALPSTHWSFRNRSLIHVLFRQTLTIDASVAFIAILALLELQFLFFKVKQT